MKTAYWPALATSTGISRRLRFSLGLFSLLTGICIGAGPTCAADHEGPVNIDREVESQTVLDPPLGLEAPVLVWPDGLRSVWLAALQHSESELRCQVADLIRQAHRYGMPGLAELQDALLAVLETPGEEPVTRTAAAAALVELDCRELAPQLAALAAGGPLQLQLVVEAGLARWDYHPAREIWLARLRDRSAGGELLRVAAESLAAVGEPRAVQPLSEVLLSPVQSHNDRLTAARALGTLAPAETVSWSRSLIGGLSPDPAFDVQLGVELLSGQSSPEAIELLEQYARWPAPTVASVALSRLLELDPSRVLARAEQTIRDRDANVREVTIAALATDPALPSIQLLAHALDDRLRPLRREARRSLLGHAADESVRPLVIEQMIPVFESDSWRDLEGAIIVLTELNHKDIKDRLLPLIDHERDEVQVTAAWAVKHLLEPDDAPAVLEAARRVTEEVDARKPLSRSQVQVQLFEALGLLKHRPAIELLSRLVPKQAPALIESRAAAIWALGLLLDSRDDTTLIRSLETRLADIDPLDPEAVEVRAAAAIALGRIGDRDSLPVLRQWYEFEGPNSIVGRSSGWAITQMTGESLPDAEPPTQQLPDWFVEPIVLRQR